MTKVSVEMEDLKAFLYYLADKTDTAYQSEVDKAIKEYLHQLDRKDKRI